MNTLDLKLHGFYKRDWDEYNAQFERPLMMVAPIIELDKIKGFKVDGS